MTDLQSCLGQRVLVSVLDGQPRMTCVRGFSPAGQYVWLSAATTDDENVGWQHVARVRVLEVIGSSTDTIQQVEMRVTAASVAAAPIDLGTVGVTT